MVPLRNCGVSGIVGQMPPTKLPLMTTEPVAVGPVVGPGEVDRRVVLRGAVPDVGRRQRRAGRTPRPVPAVRRRARRQLRAGVCACQIPAASRTMRESAAVAKPTPRRDAKAAAMPSRPAQAASASAGTGMEAPPPPARGGGRSGGARQLTGRSGADRVCDRDGERVDSVGAPCCGELRAQHRLGVRLRGGEQLHLVAMALQRELAGLGLSLRLLRRCALRCELRGRRPARRRRRVGARRRCGCRCASASTASTAATESPRQAPDSTAPRQARETGWRRWLRRERAARGRRERAGGGWAGEGSRLSG